MNYKLQVVQRILLSVKPLIAYKRLPHFLKVIVLQLAVCGLAMAIEQKQSTAAAIGIPVGATFIWIGDGGTDNQWSNPANWLVSPVEGDPDGIPDFNDNVIFDRLHGTTDRSIMDLGFGNSEQFPSVRTLTLDWDGDLYIDGELEVNQQSDWKAGRISGRPPYFPNTTLYINASATLTISGPGIKILDHDIINNGTVRFVSGDVQWDDEAQIQNLGLFLAESTEITRFVRIGRRSPEQGFFGYDGFINNNTFTRTGGSSTHFVDIEFENGSNVSIESGGELKVNGYREFESFTRVNGILSSPVVDVRYGYLEGTGTIQGSVFNSNGRISPGNYPEIPISQLVINGNYTQTNGRLEINLNSLGAADKLVVNGEVQLAGGINLLPADVIPLGLSFDVLTFARRTGDFSSKNGFSTPTAVLSPVYSSNKLTLVSEIRTVFGPDDVTSLVGLRFVGCTWNSRSRTWIQTVSIANTSSGILTGPFYLIYAGDPNLVANRTGITPSGQAYIRVNIASLSVGGSTPFITLSSSIPIRPNVVFAGPGTLQ